MSGVQIEYFFGIYFLVSAIIEWYVTIPTGDPIARKPWFTKVVVSLILILLAVFHISLIG